MLRLYHTAQSRSDRVVWLLEELGVSERVEIVPVTILRNDGSGGRDKNNPHPEDKVPVLEHDGALIMESGAIMLYLTDMFPDAGLGPPVGQPGRGAYLNWLHYYGGVIEPVLAAQFSEGETPALFQRSFRGPAEMADRLGAALRDAPYLLGDDFSAADILIATPFSWFAAMTPDIDEVKDWVVRCTARPAFARAAAIGA